LHSENVAAASPDYSTFPLTTLTLRPAYNSSAGVLCTVLNLQTLFELHTLFRVE